jgi:RNA polymerase sigma-70 factor, ECF subfamily
VSPTGANTPAPIPSVALDRRHVDSSLHWQQARDRLSCRLTRLAYEPFGFAARLDDHDADGSQGLGCKKRIGPQVRSHSDDAGSDFLLGFAGQGLDRAYRLAGCILGDAVEAQDATQDALLRAWKGRSSLRDASSAAAWFDRILVNECRDRLRRRKRIRWVDLYAGAALETRDPFALMIAHDEALHGLEHLSDDQRIAVTLRYWGDLSIEEIATRVGAPVGTVKSRLHYALHVLRNAMDDSRPGI